jgi:thiamine transport system substrate-binding protein
MTTFISRLFQEGSLRRICRIIPSAVLAVALLAAATGCAASKGGSLVVWTYDSFVSEWGPGSPLEKLFKEKTGLDVEFVSKGDGGALLASILTAGKSSGADLVVGLDNNSLRRALDSGLFAKSSPSNLANLVPQLRIDESGRLHPYDYGSFAIIWDSESGIMPPESLEDLAKPEFAKKLILMDPRSSTPGLGFLAWTEAVYKEGWQDYWSRLRPSVLTMTPGWDTGYGLFTKGEAPLVLSYSTSPAYHKAYEESERYKALVFPEGHAAQIELAGILAASKRRKDAEKFLDFLLSDEAQAILPETQWMYPANSAAVLPPSFSVVPRDIRILDATISDIVEDPEKAAGLLSGLTP